MTLVAYLFQTSFPLNADSSFLLQEIPLHLEAFPSLLLASPRGHSLFLALCSRAYCFCLCFHTSFILPDITSVLFMNLNLPKEDIRIFSSSLPRREEPGFLISEGHSGLSTKFLVFSSRWSNVCALEF